MNTAKSPFQELNYEPGTEIFWSCSGIPGSFTEIEDGGDIPSWLVVYNSKEESERAAKLPSIGWEWDGKPASAFSLEEAMDTAKACKRLGVAVFGFLDDEQIVLNRIVL